MREDYPYPVPDPPPGGWLWYRASPNSVTIHRRECRHVDEQHPIIHPPVVALTSDAALVAWCAESWVYSPCTQCITI